MTLSIAEALALCSEAGFAGKAQLVRAVAIMTAESGRNPDVIGINATIDGTSVTKSIDRGLFQINSVHTGLSNADSLRPLDNARTAHDIYVASGWTAWTTWDSGAWMQFKDEVVAEYDRGYWTLLAPYVECFA